MLNRKELLVRQRLDKAFYDHQLKLCELNVTKNYVRWMSTNKLITIAVNTPGGCSTSIGILEFSIMPFMTPLTSMLVYCNNNNYIIICNEKYFLRRHNFIFFCLFLSSPNIRWITGFFFNELFERKLPKCSMYVFNPGTELHPSTMHAFSEVV